MTNPHRLHADAQRDLLLALTERYLMDRLPNDIHEQIVKPAAQTSVDLLDMIIEQWADSAERARVRSEAREAARKPK